VFGHLPRARLATLPTPLERGPQLPGGVRLWFKRDDLTGLGMGGNKVRKLEFLLHELRARKLDRFATWGAATSNWVAAAAWHGARLGFEVSVGLGGRIPDPHARIYAASGTRVVALPRLELAPVAALAARVRGGVQVPLLPVGGSGGAGDVGSARAGTEIATDVRAGTLPEPGAVFVAVGSSGTVAGLSVGLGLGGLDVPVVAVKVADWPYGSRAMIDRRKRNILRRLGREGKDPIAPAPIVFEPRFLGSGYGRPSPEARAATVLARRDGLILDDTYGAKAFAALIAHAERGANAPYLFVHTSPGPVPV
jgi:D-cysteine desulfhydrase